MERVRGGWQKLFGKSCGKSWWQKLATLCHRSWAHRPSLLSTLWLAVGLLAVHVLTPVSVPLVAALTGSLLAVAMLYLGWQDGRTEAPDG